MTKTSDILVCPFLCLEKTIIIDRLQKVFTNSDGSCIYFLCIGCKLLVDGSIFYAWVTAWKQSLLVLLMHSTQRRENCSV